MSGIDDTAKATRKRRPRPEPTPAQRAVGLLSRREHSRKELVRKLADRGVAAADAEAAVAKLARDGWQDQARFAELLVRSRASRGYGPIHIRAELATHDLDRETIVAALAAYDGDWTENARDLVRRRYGESVREDRTLVRKAAEHLIRRGFATDQVRAATQSVPAE